MSASKIIQQLFSKKYWGGFKGRYVISIAVGATMVATLMTVFLPQFVYQTSLSLFRSQSQTLNSVLLESIGISLEFADYSSVETTFENIGQAEESVIYLNVLDNRGESVAKFEKRFLGNIGIRDFDDEGFLVGEGFIANYRSIDVVGEEYSLLLGLDNSTLTTLKSYLETIIASLVWIVVVIIVVAMVIMVELLNRPLNVLIARMQDVATGEADLTRRIEIISKDEFGELSNWFNQFLERIRKMVEQIRNSSVQVSDIGSNISSASDQMSAGAESQQGQISDMAVSIEEMAATIKESSKNSDAALKSASQAAEAAAEGGNIIQQTMDAMEQIATTVHDSSERIKELGEHSAEIGNIVAVIDKIADQTNLLALNANIEAARAGEHGRGFAVVADEVRVLAERTINATSEIGEMIKNIQGGTKNVVTAMDVGIEKVDQGVQLSEKAGNSIEQIIDMNNNVQQAINLIAVTAQEQSNGAELISENIETIKINTQDSAEAAQAVAQSAQQLTTETETLTKQVKQFKL